VSPPGADASRRIARHDLPLVSDIANQLTRICTLSDDEREDQHGVIEFYRALRSIYGITIIGEDHTYLPYC
jgi:hypothetical protein